ncbi:MAG: PQQ-dependent sugar dehydrogenase [Kofleriaceae bacterium]
MRRFALLVLVAACGDNREAPRDAPPEAGRCEPKRGLDVQAVRVVPSCWSFGAPPYPGCVPNTTTLVTSTPGGKDPRNFIVGLYGEIHIANPDGTLNLVPFLDISYDKATPPLAAAAELGLLGLVFHPNYADNGTFFIYYTAIGDTVSQWYDVVVRYQVNPDDPNLADPASGVVVISIPDFAGNHNGGMIEFGPDGMLYIGTGDGGGGGDPLLTGQDTHSLLGKILRIDVDNHDAGREYSIPPGNPFADGTGGAPEILVMGLRNPWRYSFDDLTGDLWIGDVGQSDQEEVDLLRAGTLAGANLGWSMFEGTACFKPPCAAEPRTFPIDMHTHAEGWCSVIGGDVYRGSCYPDLQGWFFYSDLCAHQLYRARTRGQRVEVEKDPGRFPTEPTTIHAGAYNELFMADTSGNIYRLEVK